MADTEIEILPPVPKKTAMFDGPLPGLGGPELLKAQGTELEHLRQAHEQLGQRLQQTDANFNKAIRLIAKMKERIGDLEAQLIEAQMDRDDARQS